MANSSFKKSSIATPVSIAEGGTHLTTIPSGSALATNTLDVLSAITNTVGTKILTNTAGTISWETNTGGTPTIITIANEAIDTTCFPLFTTAATGDLGPKTNAGLAFNSATAVLTATGFAGPLTGNVTGNVSGSSGSCTGNAGTVTNATLTTALTVNTGTLTLTANVANNSVLTIGAGASSISGANTGDNAGVTSVTGTSPVASSGGATPAISMAAATNASAGHATAAHITAIEANTAKVTNATHTGDATGDTALTVVKINGTLMSGLATGILKNTTTTGVPSIAIAADFPTLNQNTTGNASTATTAGNLSGTPALPNGTTATTQAAADNSTKLATTAYADAAAGGGGATTALSNLAAVAINTSLISDTDITDDLGTGDIRWKDIHAATLNSGLTATDTLKLRGRDVDGAAYVDILTITSANTVTADLNAITTIGGVAILYSGGDAGTPSALVGTNISGTASGLTAGAVTNATLTTALTVDTGTLTLTANAANNSVLTIGAGAVSVSGANTGDQNLAGYALIGQTMYIGTTGVAINRGTGALTLAGITLTTPDIGTPSAGTLTSCTGLPAAAVVAGSLVANMEASDHGTAATDMLVNVSYGTGDPPAANTTTEGSLFIKYTA